MSELTICKGPIRGIEAAIVIFLIGSIMGSIALSQNQGCYRDCISQNGPSTSTTTPGVTVNDLCAVDCMKKVQWKLFIAFLMIMIAFFMMIMSSATAAYRGCYKTAIFGTLLSILMM